MIKGPSSENVRAFLLVSSFEKITWSETTRFDTLLGAVTIEASMVRWVAALRLIGVGFFIGGCIAGGVLAGWWLGGKKPLFMIVGLILGLIIAAYGVYRMLLPFIGKKQDKGNS
jgi:ATP synthase protein I